MCAYICLITHKESALGQEALLIVYWYQWVWIKLHYLDNHALSNWQKRV